MGTMSGEERIRKKIYILWRCINIMVELNVQVVRRIVYKFFM